MSGGGCSSCRINDPLPPSDICLDCQGDLAFHCSCGVKSASMGDHAETCGFFATFGEWRVHQFDTSDITVDAPRPVPALEPVMAQTNVMVTVRVLMRPPLAGERGFFVAKDATAEQALADLIADDGDIGWVAQRDQPAFDDQSRIVTIEVERAP